MKNLLLLLAIFLSTGLLKAQGTDLAPVLTDAANELVDVTTEKYRYDQSLEYDAEKPWRVTVSITEVNLKNDKAETSTFYLNFADLDPKLINIETDKDEQLVVLKCRRRQKFVRLTDEDGDISYDSELQVWSPEIDKATALRDLFRQAAELAEKDWKADFSPGSTVEEVGRWLKENVVPVEVGETTTGVQWTNDPELTDAIILTISEDDGEDVKTYRFSLADLSANNLKLGVKKESVSVTAGTVSKDDLIREEEEGVVSGYESAITIPVNGIEEASRLIQVLEAALPLARKTREARMPAPTSLDGALKELSELVNGAQRGDTEVSATLSPSPLATLDVIITDSDKGDTDTERYLFDFGDLNAKKIDLRVKGTALNVVAATVKGQDYVQQWEEEEPAGFDDEVAFPVNDVETSHKLKVLLAYIIGEASKIPVPIGDFSTIEKAVGAAEVEDVTQTIEQREDDCKWSFLWVKEGKKTEEILYEYNLYDLDPKKVNYEVTNKGVFLELLTMRKEETINVYEDDEPSFTNAMEWQLNSLSDAKQLKVTMIELIEGCKE